MFEVPKPLVNHIPLAADPERYHEEKAVAAGQAIQTARWHYQNYRFQARLNSLWSRITKRSSKLQDLESFLTPSEVRGSYHLGVCSVPIEKIIGSENRSHDFDNAFHPMNSNNQERWETIAVLKLLGKSLPAVELIQVGSVYFIRDGHHRVSVSKALGQKHIDAAVTVWEAYEQVVVEANSLRQGFSECQPERQLNLNYF
jgi:hypothetical protein